MKIKLTQVGWEKYTGQMGIIQFNEGVSVKDVPFRDAARLAATLMCEFEDGSSCNPSQRLLDTAGVEAPVGRVDEKVNGELVVNLPADVQGVEKKAKVEKPVEREVEQVEGETVEGEGEAADPSLYTLEDLSKIADDKGIAGLRDIATPLNIKSNSITGLIDELLKAGAKKV